MKIAIQGGLASFHEAAAYQYFSNNIEIVYCNSFKVLCETLKNGKVDYAVMAIENSIAGSILKNYNLLQSYYFKIIGETYLHIQMHMMALPEVQLEDIQYIYSHPIALQQSEEYLYTLPKVKLVDKEDTAQSACEIKDKKLTNTAALAS